MTIFLINKNVDYFLKILLKNRFLLNDLFFFGDKLIFLILILVKMPLKINTFAVKLVLLSKFKINMLRFIKNKKMKINMLRSIIFQVRVACVDN